MYSTPDPRSTIEKLGLLANNQVGGNTYVRVPSRYASIMDTFSVHSLRLNKAGGGSDADANPTASTTAASTAAFKLSWVFLKPKADDSLSIAPPRWWTQATQVFPSGDNASTQTRPEEAVTVRSSSFLFYITKTNN
jgi:hypothetical protein